MNVMRLAEQIHLRKSIKLGGLCHSAKNLYNITNYLVRQAYFRENRSIHYYELNALLKISIPYQALPSQSSQQILRVLEQNWKSFFNACREYRAHPKKFQDRPKPPKYKRKRGEFMVIFTNQQCAIKEGYLRFPKRVELKPIKTRITNLLHQVRIIPKGLYYVLEIIYEKESIDLKLNKDRVVGIDLGLTNLLTIVNNVGLTPIVIKGGIIKSINQFYNKQLAKYKSLKDKQGGQACETERLQRLSRKRNNKVHDFFHKASRVVINFCVANNIGRILIGYNPNWKQGINLGKKNNQNFVGLPFLTLIHQIRYKGKLVGIMVDTIKEDYTSKCSFLDNEPIMHHESYLGTRTIRGLFKSKNEQIINADCNGAYNIARKVVPNAFIADGIEGVGLHPVVMNFS
jgi:putative transposase